MTRLLRHSDADEAAFVRFVEANQGWLRRLAYSLCGDRHLSDDLVQTTFTRLYVAWPRVERDGREHAYARQVLCRVAIDQQRRAWNRERPGLDGLDPAQADHDPATRHTLVQELQKLPPQQRACVTLRHWLDLSVAETAETLGISQGAVKSHTSRGLVALQARTQRV